MVGFYVEKKKLTDNKIINFRKNIYIYITVYDKDFSETMLAFLEIFLQIDVQEMG